MNIIEFFVSNYKLIIACIMSVVSAISVIISAVRRFRFFRLKDFFAYLSYAIASAESVFGSRTAELKLETVLISAKSWLDKHHLSLSDEEIIDYVELFLDTPSRNWNKINIKEDFSYEEAKSKQES